jgi:hypothetical protein
MPTVRFPHSTTTGRFKSKVAEKPRPAYIFPGLLYAAHGSENCWCAPGIESAPLVTALFYPDRFKRSICIVPGREGDTATGQVIGPRRGAKFGDRIVWPSASEWVNLDVVIYVPLLTDVKDTVTRYFNPETMQIIAAGAPKKPSLLDQLVPHDSFVDTLIDDILALYERAVTADKVTLEDVEGDYSRLQKILGYVKGGSTPGERESALRRVETLLSRLHVRCQGGV